MYEKYFTILLQLCEIVEKVRFSVQPSRRPKDWPVKSKKTLKVFGH